MLLVSQEEGGENEDGEGFASYLTGDMRGGEGWEDCSLTHRENGERRGMREGLPTASQGERRGEGRGRSMPPASGGCRGRGGTASCVPLAPREEGRGKGSSSNILHRRSTLGRLLETKVFP